MHACMQWCMEGGSMDGSINHAPVGYTYRIQSPPGALASWEAAHRAWPSPPRPQQPGPSAHLPRGPPAWQARLKPCGSRSRPPGPGGCLGVEEIVSTPWGTSAMMYLYVIIYWEIKFTLFGNYGLYEKRLTIRAVQKQCEWFQMTMALNYMDSS